MGMAEKKDPGKFTVRFNAADPQQRTVIDLLNRQGRYKAQFLTSAILHYVHCSDTPDIYGTMAVDSGEIERIVRSVLAKQQTVSAPRKEIKPAAVPRETPKSQSEDGDKDAVFRTLEAFRQQ